MGCCFSRQQETRKKDQAPSTLISNRTNQNYNRISNSSVSHSSWNERNYNSYLPQSSGYVSSQVFPTPLSNQNTNKVSGHENRNPQTLEVKPKPIVINYGVTRQSSIRQTIPASPKKPTVNTTKQISTNATKQISTNAAQLFENKKEIFAPKDTIEIDDNTSWISYDDEYNENASVTAEINTDFIVHSSLYTEWTNEDYVSESADINHQIARNIIRLLNEGNTVPFITRYRKAMTGGMDAEELRSIEKFYEEAKAIRKKATTVLNIIEKQGKMSEKIEAYIKSSTSLDDLEHIYSMFKPPTKKSILEKARKAGLAPTAEAVLQANPITDLFFLVKPNHKGLGDYNEVRNGITHIIADIMSKEKSLLEKIRELRKTTIIKIEISEGKAAKNLLSNTEETTKKDDKKNTELQKFKKYFKFQSDEVNIKQHEILAINRGESLKLLSVKFTIPNNFKEYIKEHVFNFYANAMRRSLPHETLIVLGFNVCYDNKIQPSIIRRLRKELTERAESASIEVFANNVKQLMLTPPFKGEPVLGIDPGFKNGCKLAVISKNGDVLKTAKIYPHSSDEHLRKAVNILCSLVRNYECTLIALGNGTACRETELFLGGLIKAGAFAPFEVSYTIVSEAGVSIYSCSEEARNEFPHLDPTLISAVSMARRLQDPLAELVKVEPKHLGVGMYQHDLPEEKLETALNQVVTEVVSFIGVDINTASLCLLKKVAGLDAKKAENILKSRRENGTFLNRKGLLDVEGIDSKTFEQCAGFLRILPETALIHGERRFLNYLDQTWIHPESYDIALKIIKSCHCDAKDLGSDSFINLVTAYTNNRSLFFAQMFATNEDAINLIIKGLTSPLKAYDIRSKGAKPIFRTSVTGIDSISPGLNLRGVVRNITHFGVFVDVGVCKDGLIPSRHLKGQILSIGQAIEVKVLKLQKDLEKITLEFVKVL